MRIFAFIVTIASLSLLVNNLCAQIEQIDFQRIELMPNQPSPYSMRDWERVATGYDSFVYDITKTGDYLPLVFIKDEGVNYPERPNFGLDTYVGTFSNDNGEGINVLSSLVSASLVGIDKTNQYGRNWILMSQDYFNKANGENLYLNNIGGHSGSDWWYDMMPNIYFYQLYDLYGNIGDAEFQFHSVADKMDAAVRTMGGKATPWTRAFMDYRAFDFLQMQPNPDGVHEPEAAGAFAWLLYHAYNKTGNPSYLQSAEWSMEYLVNLNSNPSYELQLPYGAYAAARMNAEIGTEYNVEKILFWIFNRGPLRGWGTIADTWNGFDVSGLVGEANETGNDYAFQLNGVQQASALAPLARYDKRFARTIGKYILNLANATRLMFPGFLPDHLQDASAWSDEYDPEGVMGYEALREVWNSQSPVSTGDALRSGWAATNLSLYSTSSVGYLGAIINKTDVDKILQIDLLKTDFFHDTAYPSFLYFNPYDDPRIVTLDAGTEAKDVYEVLSESYLAQNVSGNVQLEIPADQAISIVLAPAGGTRTYSNNKTLINGVVVDYLQTTVVYNYPPRIQAFAVEDTLVEKNNTITLFAKGIDQETKDLIYTFYMPDDTVSGLERTAEWTAPSTEGVYLFTLIAEDEHQQRDTATLTITVVEEINIAPEIITLSASKRHAFFGDDIHFNSEVQDANDDVIHYEWRIEGGNVISTDATLEWTAPSSAGIYTISLQVTDGNGGSDIASLDVIVLDASSQQSGDLIAWYPFEGNANDMSGNNLHGQVFGAKLIADSTGNPQAAYWFDGINDHIRVSNQAILNFTDGITLSFFANPEVIGDKERFMISHGSYQNRWKISITPDRKVRWTIKNATGQVRDLDSETILEEDMNYHIAATYDNTFMILYINGRPEAFTTFAGNINASPLDLEIAQQLPDDANYNYRGILDEVKIYDYALAPDSVAAESGIITSVDGDQHLAGSFHIFPNPASSQLRIDLRELEVPVFDGIITILDMWGREVFSSFVAQSPTTTINVSSFTPGMYLVRYMDGHHLHLQKLIIE